MRGGTLCLCLLSAAFAVAAAERGDACASASSQTEINACSSDRYRQADEEMNQVYRRVKARLRAGPAAKLVQTQRAWIRFRDLQCNLESSSAGGGSAYAALRNGCLARLTSARTDDLKRILHDM